MLVSTGRDLTELMCPPRSLFVNFPMGNAFGPAGESETQRSIVMTALELAASAEPYGTIVDLDLEWRTDFTEKTTLTVDIAEITGMEISITGKWKIGEGKLVFTDRRYHNPDGPAGAEVAEFIEEHTDISISFSMFSYPLDVTDFKFDGDYLSVVLERV